MSSQGNDERQASENTGTAGRSAGPAAVGAGDDLHGAAGGVEEVQAAAAVVVVDLAEPVQAGGGV